MSKQLVYLSRGMMQNSLRGAILALVCYALMQCLTAFLIDKEILAYESLSLGVYFSAAAASFVGCFYSAMRSGKGMILNAVSVIAVFLLLTIAIALCMSTGELNGAELTIVGIAMSAGGLAAALFCSVLGNRMQRGRVGSNPRRGRK